MLAYRASAPSDCEVTHKSQCRVLARLDLGDSRTRPLTQPYRADHVPVFQPNVHHRVVIKIKWREETVHTEPLGGKERFQVTHT